MIDYDRILCPVDFSERAQHALRHAMTLCEKFSAELCLLHVVQLHVPFAPPMDAAATLPYADWLREDRQRAEQALAELPGNVVAAGGVPNVVRELRDGTPFVEIVRYAAAHAVDLIVLGTHGRTGLSHMLLGSVAEKVVRKAPCPVLTVRAADHEFEMP